ncbi:choice-of-anchor Q domain-containing protein [Verrucomicrobiaceae bacterium 227]
MKFHALSKLPRSGFTLFCQTPHLAPKRYRAFLSALLSLVLPAVAPAETFTVTTHSDITDESDKLITLREAITLANESPGPDTINFSEELSGKVITLNQGEFTINDDLSIDASNLAHGPVVDADRKSRIINFTAPEGNLKLAELILRNGMTGSRHGPGGGILFSSSGTISLTDCTLSENHGGGIYSGNGSISLTNTTLSENRGGKVWIPRAWSLYSRTAWCGGGIFTLSGRITITNSTLSGNSAPGQYVSYAPWYPGFGGGIYSATGDITVINSTLTGNFTTGDSGRGGAICSHSGAITIINSTLVGNSSSGDSGGAIYARLGAVSITSSTITGNIARRGGTGGGIFTENGPLVIANSIIAGNFDQDNAPDDIKPPQNPGNQLEISHSLIGNSTGARLDEAKVNLNNLIDVDPILGSLADNGSDTLTMLPFPGSPVINAGTTTDLNTDQRGLGHSGIPDIGAVEYQGSSDLSRIFDIDNDHDGNSFGIEQALGTDPFSPDQNHPNNLDAPTVNGNAQPVLNFGLGEDAHPDTLWILERSTDLVTFEQIYSFDGTADFAIEGIPIEVNRTAERVTITDEAPPAKGAYYRFKSTIAGHD